MEQHYSKERVERNNVLLYIEGDPIDPEDTQTLEEQGFIEKKKPTKAPTNKAKKAAGNK